MSGHTPAPAVNEMGAAWDRHYGNTGLGETDRMVLIVRDLTNAKAEIARLQRTLVLKDGAIALLRDCLADAEQELDTLRAMLAERVAA